MANGDFAFGLKPVRHAYGSPFMGAGRVYIALASYAVALFIGDPVKKVGTSDGGEGYQTINRAAAGDAITGVVIGFEDVPSLQLGYGAASTLRRVIVADDPTLLFEIQEDADGGALALAAVGQNADIVVASGSTATRTSGVELDSSTAATTDTLVLKIIEFVHRADNEPASANAKVLVAINQHTENPRIAGV